MKTTLINTKIFGIGLSLLLFGCSSLHTPKTTAERQSGFTYVPIDPFSVDIGPNTPARSLKGTNILQSLPDNAVRIAVEQLDYNGNVDYGPTGVSIKGGSYRVTADYINSDTANVKLRIAKWVSNFNHGTNKYVRLHFGEPIPQGFTSRDVSYDVTRVTSLQQEMESETNSAYVGELFNIPLYIGIGLRVTADITTFQGNLNITGLGAIGGAAEAKQLAGSLVVQTLGVNGKSIAAALPIQSELNRTTTQNAIVSVGAIKALLYESETVVVPRVVGLYLPFPADKPLVNRIISEISKERIQWTPPVPNLDSTNAVVSLGNNAK